MASLLQSPDVASVSGIGRSPVLFNLCFNTLSTKIRTFAVDREIRRNRRIGATGFRVCASTGECRVSASGSVQNLGNYCYFSAPTRRSWTHVQGGDDKENYYVNAGHAIRTLRDEFPGIFYREPSFDIYREDITFKDPVNTFVGIKNYKLICWALRINGRIFFKALWVDIISVRQPVENTVLIRWAVHGIPRVPWESHGRFDGTSEYKLDRNGKIFEHRVDNVAMNSPPKFRVVSVEELIQALGCPSSARPTCFETLSSLVNFIPFLITSL
ncbi:uncharacterized protein [Aristolochia californica]|uniref:uncharacterized protein n=1 Tax=Aristolochia californica TaxID=171875 RepID=UPI0035DF6D3B